VFILISSLGTEFVLISRLSTVFILFRFAYLLQSKFIVDSMILASSMLQIRRHGYSRHFNFFISIVGFVIRSFYAINSGVVSLFVYSSFFIFSELNM
jgi:hypothetical protein